jgi:hypothetical protein
MRSEKSRFFDSNDSEIGLESQRESQRSRKRGLAEDFDAASDENLIVWAKAGLKQRTKSFGPRKTRLDRACRIDSFIMKWGFPSSNEIDFKWAKAEPSIGATVFEISRDLRPDGPKAQSQIRTKRPPGWNATSDSLTQPSIKNSPRLEIPARMTRLE